MDTLNDLDNVLYEVTNEGGYKDWDRFVVDTVHAYEKTKPKQHPVGLTGHGSENNDEMLASPADWFSPGSDPWPDLKSDPRAVDGKKVSLLDTDHVFGVGGDQKWVWKAFLRGHNVLFMDPYDDPAWAPILAGQGVGVRNAEASRRAMGHARRYAGRIDLAASRPAGELASTEYCLAVPGPRVPGLSARRGSGDRGPLGREGEALRGVDAPDHGQDHPRRGGGGRRKAHPEGALRRRRRPLRAGRALSTGTQEKREVIRGSSPASPGTRKPPEPLAVDTRSLTTQRCPGGAWSASAASHAALDTFVGAEVLWSIVLGLESLPSDEPALLESAELRPHFIPAPSWSIGRFGRIPPHRALRPAAPPRRFL